MQQMTSEEDPRWPLLIGWKLQRGVTLHRFFCRVAMPVLAADCWWIVHQEVARASVRVVGVAHLSSGRAGIKRTTVHGITRVMTHASRLQVCTVIKSTLLPADATRDASGAAALTATDTSQSAHSAHGRRTAVFTSAVAATSDASTDNSESIRECPT